jgi:hypothetical protein
VPEKPFGEQWPHLRLRRLSTHSKNQSGAEIHPKAREPLTAAWDVDTGVIAHERQHSLSLVGALPPQPDEGLLPLDEEQLLFEL